MLRTKVASTGWQRFGRQILHITFRTHLLISALIRLVLICYGQIHDSKSAVPYTDIDYKVVTDGARQVLAGDTPFARHTYRYSPIMAYLQTLNILVHPACGKLLYATFDLLIATLIYHLVHMEIKSQYQKTVQHLLSKFNRPHEPDQSLDALDERSHPENIARVSACCWLYNPLTAVISTRGSGDCFSSFFVILTIYLLIRSEHKSSQKHWLIFAAGLSHGLVIHLRLYPLLFSLAYYLSLSSRLTRTPFDFLRQIMRPNKQQFCLVLGTLLSLVAFTWTFYSLYGWQYIYEAYLYHFVRKDPRHNFSLQFLLQYLGSAATVEESALLTKLLVVAPQFCLILYLSLSFGQFRQTLPFCIFTVAFVIVTYNSVVTSQYFIWYLAILPLCLNNFKLLSWSRSIFLLVLWLLAQALWLLPAYLLEFKTWNSFNWIGLQGAVFFVTNGYILEQLLSHYGFTQFKISYRKLL
ncbi:GL11273 [Drosophila persimilis]|uniref:GPI alpha-1,4-mannosyltransferase I, catalytic subunit n=1 Tax=Drosophila persimilis TaxID=7234 RepID=B4G9Y0_DROPE|nr:GPI mannosyltransferase 1 [Drosophila persimilis]EDW31732.1 GL11273 [Drosophila persimilis]